MMPIYRIASRLGLTMKKWHLIILTSCILTGCNLSLHDALQLKAMKSRPISFPPSLQMTIGGDTCDFNRIPAGIKLIVYADSSICNSCLVSKLEKYHAFEHNKDCNLSVVFILAPKGTERKSVLHELSLFEHIFPVYFDRAFDFLKENTHIPKDPRYHIFLVDTSNVPVFVGDPASNETMMNMFYRKLQSISK